MCNVLFHAGTDSLACYGQMIVGNISIANDWGFEMLKLLPCTDHKNHDLEQAHFAGLAPQDSMLEIIKAKLSSRK